MAGEATIIVREYDFSTGAISGSPWTITESSLNFGSIQAGKHPTPKVFRLRFKNGTATINSLTDVDLALTNLGTWGAGANRYGITTTGWTANLTLSTNPTWVFAGTGTANEVNIGFRGLTTDYIWLDVQPLSTDTGTNSTIDYSVNFDFK